MRSFRRLEYLRSIYPQLVGAILLVTVGLVATYGLLVYRTMARSFDRQLGRHLVAIAELAATRLEPSAIAFLAPGDEETRTAKRLRTQLQQIQQKAGLRRIIVLDRDLTSRLDTRTNARIGDRPYDLAGDSTEIKSAFAGRSTTSVLFEGADGRMFKRGYAPVGLAEKPLAVLGVEGNATYFDELHQLARTLAWIGAAMAGVGLLLILGISRQITRPLKQLGEAARRIGRGQLADPVLIPKQTEMGTLAKTLNQMRRDLLDRDQQLQLMLAGIAHEVRNPLAGIKLFAGLLRDELKGSTETTEHIERIEQEVQLLEKLVDDFLSYTRKKPIVTDQVSLKPILEQAIELSEGEAAARKIRFLLDAPSSANSYIVNGDAEQLRRVALNVLRNAAQASPDGSTVEVALRATRNNCEFQVRDEGSGIAPSLRDQIFLPFFTTREKGSGLGLALSKKIVEAHQGSIQLEARQPRGTIVTVALPTSPVQGNDD